MDIKELINLKLHVEKILKLQKKYGWMMDSYVLDFFSDNLWDKLPRNWTNVLDELHSEEIAYFFLEMYRPFDSKNRQDLQTPKFRNVWPLELLAYIASCHALNLNNKTLIEELNYTQNIMDRSTVLKRTKWDHTKSVEYETNNISNARDIHVSSDIEKDTIQKEEQILQRGGQNFNLSHPFRRHIKPKKQYEIDILSKVICEQAKKLKCYNIVDVGAGLGHLSRLLSYGCKLRVVTIESDGCHQKGADKIDQKVLAHLRKKAEPSSKSLIHITHHINTDISAAEFSNVVLQAFSSMENINPQNITNEKPGYTNCENFIIVGLHTCGDLASTLLRVFTQCYQAVGIISVGCCYMKLSHEKMKKEYRIATQKVQRLDKISTECDECDSTSICGKFEQGQGESMSCYDSRTVVESTNVNSTQLCSNCEQNKTDNGKTDEEPALSSLCSSFDFISIAEDEKILGYPMSDYVKSLSNHQQTYNALESACHAIEKYHKKLLESSPTLKLHYYRALLELLLKQKDPSCGRRQIRTLRTKKASQMTFTEYVNAACSILGVEEQRPTLQEVQIAEELHVGKELNVVIFYVLRLLMAPVIEGRILVDRLIYLRERYSDINARISVLFDPDISPRNFAIICEKTYKVKEHGKFNEQRQ